jgi:hypothetical protein
MLLNYDMIGENILKEVFMKNNFERIGDNII